jgi:long-chain acyl-CoA synthetase
VVLGVLPQFHSFGFTVLTMMPLAVGARAIYTARFMPKKIVDLASRHRPTALVAIPSMYNALRSVKDAPKDAFSSLRFAVSGGEPLPQSVSDGFHDTFGVRIAEGYGLTETSPVVSWCLPHEYRWKSVGRPLHGVQFLIADANGQPVPQGHDGEVRIKGPNVMKGYFNLPTETAAAFDADGWFRTGDQGRLDADGHLSITGRIKEMLIIAGENVFPREIEEVLNQHPSVNASGVVGIKDPIRGELPMAFIELREGQTFDKASIQAHCRASLAGYKVPGDIRVLEALPRNPTGKIMRRELVKLLAATPEAAAKG